MKRDMNRFLVEICIALVTTNLWLPILWIIDHPVEEWIGVVVIWYVSYSVARLVVANLTVVLAIWLVNRARRLAEQLDIDIDSYRDKRPASIVLAVFLVMAATVFGLTLAMMNPVLSLAGLTSLGFALNLIAWTFLGVGLLIQITYFFGFYLLFRLTEKKISQSDKQSKSHQNVTKLRDVLRRISRGDIHLGLPQPWLSALRLPLN